jgi:hypothetical protein
MSIKSYDEFISLVGDHQRNEGIRRDDTGSKERPVKGKHQRYSIGLDYPMLCQVRLDRRMRFPQYSTAHPRPFTVRSGRLSSKRPQLEYITLG